MADRVAISNLSLSKLGETDRIIDPADDTKPAREIAAVWDASRRTVLRKHTWNFATRRAAVPGQVMAGADLDAIWPFTRAYALPTGVLRFVELIDDTIDASDYQLESGLILANVGGPLRVRCIFDVTDTARWDDEFVEAFACFLAWQVADPISGDRARKLDAWQSYKDALQEAKVTDARENPPIEQAESSWLESRFGA